MTAKLVYVMNSINYMQCTPHNDLHLMVNQT